MEEMQRNKEYDQLHGDDAYAVDEARRVTWVGFWINAVLGLAKVVGILFRIFSAT